MNNTILALFLATSFQICFCADAFCRITSIENVEIYTNSLGQVSLNWDAAEDVSNDLFSIERSSDGEVWWKIGEVHPLNKANIVHRSYSYADDSPMNGVSFYRVKSTLDNGERINSNPQMIYIEVNDDLKIIPDTKKKEINIYLKGSILKDVQLFGPSGMPIQVDYFKEPYASKLKTEDLNPGKYNLTLITDRQTINRQIIII